MSNEIKMFKFQDMDVEILEIDGKVLFEVYSTGMALGYINKAKGKLYPHKSRINKIIENVEISTVVHGVQQYFTEEQLYDFMLEAHTDKCKSFRKWVVGEVLPTINKTGAYIVEGREEEMVELYFPSFSEDIKLGMVKDLLKTNKELKVKADKFNNFMDKDGTFGYRNLVKHLNGLGCKVKENEVRELLKDKGIICKQGNKYVISQNGIREDYGVIRDNIVNDVNRPESRYTDKLRDYLVDEFKDRLIESN